jgi:hypothetical protein
LGEADEFKPESVTTKLITLDQDFNRRVEMSNRGKEFVDEGGLQRILNLVHDIMIG